MTRFVERFCSGFAQGLGFLIPLLVAAYLFPHAWDMFVACIQAASGG